MQPNRIEQLEVALLVSGGIDSTAAAHFFTAKGHLVRGIFIDYGQAARQQEWQAVQALAQTFSIGVKKINCFGTKKFGAGELIGRNAFLVSTAVFLGDLHRGFIAVGVHAGTPYYDCSAVFVERMKTIVEEQSNGALTLVAPFLEWRKPEIFSYCESVGLSLVNTYSCERGTSPPCASCASCRDREALGC